MILLSEKGATGFVSRTRMTRNDASKLFIAKQQVAARSLSESWNTIVIWAPILEIGVESLDITAQFQQISVQDMCMTG